MCIGTSCVQVHHVYRYIMCTGTSCVQVHHVYRYTLYVHTSKVLYTPCLSTGAGSILKMTMVSLNGVITPLISDNYNVSY